MGYIIERHTGQRQAGICESKDRQNRKRNGAVKITLKLSVRFYFGEYPGWRDVVTDLRGDIYKRFTEAGIVMAFPQRDVHLDTEQPIRIVVDPKPIGGIDKLIDDKA